MDRLFARTRCKKIAVNNIEGTTLENTHRIYPENVTLKSALVVDDSRVALASLSRMLKEHGIAVDTAESGSEAIDYLRLNLHPSVIFLDHMMPGMDGFETLRLLKSDPNTSRVPVVMYTSTEGESYMGQALAVGAIDVLRKPIDPMELMRILRRLRTGSDQEVRQRVLLETPVHISHEATARSSVTSRDEADKPSPRGVSGRGQRERLATITSRPRTESQQATHSADGSQNYTQAVPASSTALWLKRGLYTALLLLPTFWYWQQYRHTDQLWINAQKEIGQLNSQVQHAASDDETTQLRDSLATQQRLLRTRTRALTNALAWAVNLQGQYDYDQLPLGDERLFLLRELMTRLNAAEFQGVVRIETYVGEFCLVRDEQGAYRMPPRNLLFSRCEVVTHSPEYAALLGRRQSTEFARFLAEPSPNIQIDIISRGNSRPLTPYPDRSLVQTAGEWNQIARQNNRTDISIIPSP